MDYPNRLRKSERFCRIGCSLVISAEPFAYHLLAPETSRTPVSSSNFSSENLHTGSDDSAILSTANFSGDAGQRSCHLTAVKGESIRRKQRVQPIFIRGRFEPSLTRWSDSVLNRDLGFTATGNECVEKWPASMRKYLADTKCLMKDRESQWVLRLNYVPDQCGEPGIDERVPRCAGSGTPDGARAPQHLARLGAGVLPVLDHHDAVHEHPVDAGREFHRALVGGPVVERLEVKDRHVGP